MTDITYTEEPDVNFCHICGSQLIEIKDTLLCPCCGHSICCCPLCKGSEKGVNNVQSSIRSKLNKGALQA